MIRTDRRVEEIAERRKPPKIEKRYTDMNGK
jgi:hypothetical protein